MAKYTMLLAEYLAKGGALPSSFALINGFEDLFVAHYCDHEIGFETDTLFKIKLEEKATLFMQVYADKIQKLASAWLQFDAPVKVHYTQEYRKLNAGAQHGSTTELPINATSATPSIQNDADAYENNENVAHTLQESGDTHEEVQSAIDFLNRAIEPLLLKLLNEFRPLFMQVY